MSCLSLSTYSRENSFKIEIPLTHKTLYQEIQKYGIKYPDIVFAQAILETGHFTSPLFKESNNLFGMKMPSKRETLAIGKERRGFAVFNHWSTSINDYLLWQNYILEKHDVKTKSDYFNLLDDIYATNEKYVLLLKKIISDHQHLF